MAQSPQPTAADRFAPKLPPAVAALAANADRLQREQPGQPAPAVVTDPEPEPTEPKTHPTPPPPVVQQPTPAPTPPPPVPPAPTGLTEGEMTNRIKAAEGRAARAEETNRTLSQRIDGLQVMLATLQSAPAAQPTASPAAGATPGFQPLTEAEEEEYGKDLMGVVARKAQMLYDPIVNELKAEIAQLKGAMGAVGGSMMKRTQDEMYRTMTQEVPNWRVINRDPEYLAWLAGVDPYSGKPRDQMLQEAFSGQDGERVVSFFKGYLSEVAATDPSKYPASPSSGPTTRAEPRPTLESLAAPGKARPAAASTAPAEKPLIRRADITAFYTAVAAGKWKGREAEVAQHEAELFQATNEGRVIG